ncbi:restriction endonuclease [Reyranella sp. CPCC 100927]|uniref:restriction endonuclease n=1 Tax=Reyranella sp. CPCC 100927 TaxID=2599616 RepID=UPI002101F0BD|nr:restriction endonuclease [Reyranella sp. CPCC 100927]
MIDELFGMSSGYVLDFTNRTFADFFYREVGVDIYDDAYAIYGSSKGKHLRAFLTIGQPRAIARALAALWEYREESRLGQAQAETVANARQRLSVIVERLGGTPLSSFDTAATESKEETKPRIFRVNEATLRHLEERFLALHQMSDEPQMRGYHFEKLLTELFNAWGMDARGGFRVVGEQIDGSFQLDGDIYLLEAKWQRAKTDANALHAFQGKVSERPEWTRGLFVGFAGFTDVGLRAFTARKIILADGLDIYDALARRLSFADIIAAKVRYASEYRNPFQRVRSLFPL